MTTTPILGRDVYLALAAVGWADGQLTKDAADAIVRAALEEGLALDVVKEIEEACKTKVELGLIDRMNMSKSDRLYVYAVASWIAMLDGHLSEKEQAALGKLADILRVPPAPRRHADRILRDIVAQSEEGQTHIARFDLVNLRLTLDRNLEEARRMRLAQFGNPDDSQGGPGLT
ncbi:MAG: hypothetical protein NVS3B20_02200 [Polyangiales bacterium]